MTETGPAGRHQWDTTRLDPACDMNGVMRSKLHLQHSSMSTLTTLRQTINRLEYFTNLHLTCLAVLCSDPMLDDRLTICKSLLDPPINTLIVHYRGLAHRYRMPAETRLGQKQCNKKSIQLKLRHIGMREPGDCGQRQPKSKCVAQSRYQWYLERESQAVDAPETRQRLCLLPGCDQAEGTAAGQRAAGRMGHNCDGSSGFIKDPAELMEVMPSGRLTGTCCRHR